MAPRIEIQAVLDAAGVGRGVSRIRGELGGVRRMASQTGSVFRGVLGANALGKAGQLAASGISRAREELTGVKEAGSALQQSTGAVDAVFGRYAAGIKKSAGEAEQALGLSRNEYQELTSVIGAGLKNKGLSDFAAQTEKVTALGADLAAQYGGSTRQAVEAISSLMRGESDPIEQYGVSINETAVAAALAAKGQNKLTGAALEQAKARERLNLLFKQTTDAQGAFNREAGTYAGLEQRNAAAIENTKAKIGTALLPALTAGQKALAEKVLPVVNQAADAFGRELPGALQRIQTVAGPILASLQGHVERVAAVVQGAFSGGGTGGGPDQLLAKLAPLRDAFVSLIDGASQLGTAVLPIVLQVGQALGQTLIDNAPAIRQAGADLVSIGQSVQSIWTSVGPVVIPVVQSVFSTVIGVVSGAVTTVAGLLGTIAALLRGDLPEAGRQLERAFSGAGDIIEAIGNNIINQSKVMATAVVKAFTGVEVDADRAWADFPSNVGKIWNRIVTETAGAVTRFNRAVIAGFTGARDSAVSAVTGLRDRVVGGLTAMRDRAAQQVDLTRLRVVSAVTGMASSVVSQVGTIPGRVGAGFRAVQSVASSALGSMSTVVRTKVGEAVTTISGLPGRAAGALSGLGGRLYAAGASLVGGFIQGIRDSFGRVQATLGSLTSMLPSWKGPPARDRTILTDAGRMVVDGFVVGLRSQFGAVRSTMTDLTSDAISTARSTLGIASPSKVFAELGKFVGQGLARGVTGSRSEVDTAIKTLTTRMQAVFKQQADLAKAAAVAGEQASVKRWRTELSEATKARTKIAANEKRYATLTGQKNATTKALRENEAAQRRYTGAAGRLVATERALAAVRAGGITKAERKQYAALTKQRTAAKRDAAAGDRLAKAGAKLREKLAANSKARSALRAETGSLSSDARGFARAQAQLRAAEARLAKARKVSTTDQAYARTQAEIRQQSQLIKSLQVNAAARERIGKILDGERKQLTDMIKVRDDYDRSVRDSAAQFASITAISPVKEGATLTSRDLTQGLRDRLNAIVNFRDRLARLAKLGVNSSTYDQIARDGVEGGMDTLNALLAGGKAAVAEVNRLQKQINAESSKLGDTAADRLYKAGIDAQKGLIAGLVADEAALDKAAARFASKLTAAVKRELGIRSPSRVFRAIGGQTVAGLVQGLDERTVATAGRDLARSMVAGFSQPKLDVPELVGSSSDRSAGNTYKITVNPTPLATPADIGREIVGAIREYERTGGR